LREEYCTASAGALLAVVGRTGLRLLCYLVRSVSAGKCYFSANDCRLLVALFYLQDHIGTRRAHACRILALSRGFCRGDQRPGQIGSARED
jgi:hypothetical protein